MGQIYEQATHTIIFLGPSDGVCESVLSRARDDNAKGMETEDLKPAIREMTLRPWFHRVWIFQEVVLLRDPIVQIGASRYPWELLCDYLRKAFGDWEVQAVIMRMNEARSKYHTPIKEDASSTAFESYKSLRAKKRARMQEFVGILENRRGLGAADARDMIFAYLGLVKDNGLSMEYSQSVEQIYIQFAQQYCQKSNDLSILSHVDEISFSDRRSGLPSWVPNWTVGRHKASHRISSCYERGFLKGEGYKAPPSLAEMRWDIVRNKCPYIIEQPYILFAVGYSFAKIQEDQLSVIITQDMLEEFPEAFPKGVKGEEEDDRASRRLSGHGPAPTKLRLKWDWWRERIAPLNGVLPPVPSLSDFWCNGYISAGQNVIDLLLGSHENRPILCGRRIALKGKWTVVPACTEVGDEICFLDKFDLGLVVRKQEFSAIEMLSAEKRRGPIGTFDSEIENTLVCVKVIGECFVDGMFAPDKGTKGYAPSVFAII